MFSFEFVIVIAPYATDLQVPLARRRLILF